MKTLIKKLAGLLPAFIGTRLSFIDFRYRLGSDYSYYRETANNPPSKEDIYLRVRSLVEYCEANIPFYAEFYKSKRFSSSQIRSFSDLDKIPIVTKNDLQRYRFEDRVSDSRAGIVTNTGGTSGQPLKLLMDDGGYAREWGYMHSIWHVLGYKTSSIKLTFRGMNLGSVPIKYNFIHNEFQVNAYCDLGLIINALEKLLNRYEIEFLHGYPSGIYDFVKQLSGSSPTLLGKLKRTLKGVFFGSEYPAPLYRTYIEKVLAVDTISWYGHTEMAVLATEKQKYLYYPFQNYGFTEAVEIDGAVHLVGTTIHNKIGPLVRYDTGDLIKPVSYHEGILESFQITEGRIGEFVVDKSGRNISLTALIFGRHHKIFEEADFVQVHQEYPGKLDVIVTTQNESIYCADLFDSSQIDMEISFITVTKPYRTRSGKVSLLVENY